MSVIKISVIDGLSSGLGTCPYTDKSINTQMFEQQDGKIQNHVMSFTYTRQVTSVRQ